MPALILVVNNFYVIILEFFNILGSRPTKVNPASKNFASGFFWQYFVQHPKENYIKNSKQL